MAIIDNLKRIMHEHKLTQTDVAKIIGRDRSAISKAFSGERQLKADEIVKIAESVGVPISALAGAEDELINSVPIIEAVPDKGFDKKVSVPITGYLPHKAASNTLFATRVTTEEMNLLAPLKSFIIVDYGDVIPENLDNKTVLAFVEKYGQVLRKFRQDPDRLESYSSKPHETIYLKDKTWLIIGRVVGVVTDLQDD